MSSCSRPSRVVIIFTKYPTPGYAKTRLIPAVGAQRAAEISGMLSERIVNTVRRLISSHGLPSTVSRIFFAAKGNDEDEIQQMRTWLGYPKESFADRELMVRQASGDLGNRLTAAFAACFEEGASKVVVVGSDIPEIDATILSEAFTRLDDSDIVIGPSEDGGYYLLGMKECHVVLFQGIAWSTETVCEQTTELAKQAGLSIHMLSKLRDIDIPEDLPYLERVLGDKPS